MCCAVLCAILCCVVCCDAWDCVVWQLYGPVSCNAGLGLQTSGIIVSGIIVSTADVLCCLRMQCWTFSACMSLVTAITLSRCHTMTCPPTWSALVFWLPGCIMTHNHALSYAMQCWTFSACMSLITAITTFMQRHYDLPTDWDITDLVQQGGPSTSSAQAALRSLTAAAGTAGAAHDSLTSTPFHGVTSLSASTASMPALPPTAWQLGAVDVYFGLDGSGSGAAEAIDEDVPPLDLALLCGRAILPGNVGLLMQEGEQRR